jgi:glyoxylase-like metal-dependent hydrolase (beta-lactamase superfamily II)/rhodanese-related sulfurtransferase
MTIEQIYTGCLAQGAYYITSGKEAIIIDPLREIYPYLERAKKDGVAIKYILETHFHADFVSGHLDLAKASGATIVFGPTAQTAYHMHCAADGEILQVGDISIKVLHTPGHTMESTCFLLLDAQGKEVAVFTGDTLFIGDVGRPDLAQKVSEEFTQEKQAGLLYDSLRTKLMTLPDDVIVYPAHGAGSACGKNMSKETTSTIGLQKQNNYALRADMLKAEFIDALLDGLSPSPAYFPANVMMNKNGYKNIDAVLAAGTKSLTVEEFELIANETEVLILDTREAQMFAQGHIPNSINIGIDGGFAPWVGNLVPDIEQPLLLVTDEGREEEVVTRLARVGYDYALGFIAGGFNAWKVANKDVATITSISANDLANILHNDEKIAIVDVRKPTEFEGLHIQQAINLPLDYINDNMNTLDKHKTYYIHCAGGYRSMIFASILQARGFDHLIEVKGGFKEIKETAQFSLVETSLTA